MKRKNIIIILIVIIVLIVVFYSVNDSQNNPAYTEEIKKEREEKDRFMKSSKESPFATLKEEFTGLKYFEPDTKYRVVANLSPITDKKVVVLPTSDGKEQRYLEYANATFTLDGVDCKLTILEVMETGIFRGKLFLAFGDETSANETYGAGRYLDLNKTPGSNTITLDFNKAYNPYCAYNDTYSCPFPPTGNLLKVSIKAGEKTYHD
jgi:uncharacterized protein (DUF1684 family)